MAIRIAERDETAVVGPRDRGQGLSFRSEVKRLAHFDSAIDKLSPRGLNFLKICSAFRNRKFETPNPGAPSPRLVH
jgi:hypothetical protein